MELPTKRQLGIGYLAGVGVALSITLVGYVVFSPESPVFRLLSGFVASTLYITIIYIGYLFVDITLSEDFVWRVAEWTAVGFGIATLVSFAIGLTRHLFPDAALLPSLLIITIAAGGLIGTLFGVITGLREQHHRMREITQRNTVMNRVLRHNIRNDMNVIHGNAQILHDECDTNTTVLNRIQTTAQDVIRLSEAAKRIDELTMNTQPQPINVTRVSQDLVETVREKFPDATVSTDLDSNMWAVGDPILRFVLMNVMENAIEHNDTKPEITISIREKNPDNEMIRITVTDNGPGIPDTERDILYQDKEDPLHHGNGLGLWLVKWFVDQYDGALHFEENHPRGTIVHLDLPAASSTTHQPNSTGQSIRQLPMESA